MPLLTAMLFSRSEVAVKRRPSSEQQSQEASEPARSAGARGEESLLSFDFSTVVQRRSTDPAGVWHQAFTERAPVASSLRLDRLDGRLLDILRRSRNLSTERRKDNLEVRRRTLVRVDPSVCPVRTTAVESV